MRFHGDSVVRTAYYKYTHPKECYIDNCKIHPEFLKTIKKRSETKGAGGDDPPPPHTSPRGVPKQNFLGCSAYASCLLRVILWYVQRFYFFANPQ